MLIFYFHSWLSKMDMLNLGNYFDWDTTSSYGIAAEKYIYIGGSSMWPGVHKIKSASDELWKGWLQLYTKYPATGTYTGDRSMTFDGADETITFTGAEDFCKVACTHRHQEAACHCGTTLHVCSTFQLDGQF